MIRSFAGAPRWSILQIASAMVVLVAWTSAMAQAPSPNLGRVNDATKQSSNTAAIQTEVQNFIGGAVKQLAEGDADVQSKARQALIAESLINGQPTASPAYLSVYAITLDRALQPLAKHQSPRVRINAAIVAANVAQHAGNASLANAALAFTSDASDAVVLWGLKAARWIIPAQLAVPGGKFDPKLADAVIPAVQKHDEGQIAGPIAIDAYDALALDVFDPARMKTITPTQIKTMVPYVLKLLQTRLTMYQKGVPPAPRADADGTGFLGNPNVWPHLTKPQQKEAMQAFSDLIGLAGQQAGAANAGDLVELTLAIQRAAATIAIRDAALAPGVQAASSLKPGQAKPDEVQKAAAAVLPALRQHPDFKDLKPPPQIQDTKPAPAPASAPTTGPVVLPGAAQPLPGGAAPAAGGNPPAPAGGTPPTPAGGTAPGAGATPPQPRIPAPNPNAQPAQPAQSPPPGGAARNR